MRKETAARGVGAYPVAPVVLDTGSRRVLGRGVKSRIVIEDGIPVIYLRLGVLGWIRFDSWVTANWVVAELTAAIDQADREASHEAR